MAAGLEKNFHPDFSDKDAHKLKSLDFYRNLTDEQVWRAFLQDNRIAYAFIYEKFYSSLYNYGYKFAQDRQLTEDCIQDMFIYILEHRESISETDSIKYYLFKALRSEIFKRAKRQLNHQGLHREEEMDFKLAFSYEASWMESRISQERTEQLLHELNQLPSRQKEAIFLRFYNELSFAEIADVMGIEQTSVYKVMYKAFASLQKKIYLRHLLGSLSFLHFFFGNSDR